MKREGEREREEVHVVCKEQMQYALEDMSNFAMSKKVYSNRRVKNHLVYQNNLID